MFSEAERGWTSAISDALRDEQQTVLLQFEAAMREGQARHSGEMAEERGRLQRGLELAGQTSLMQFLFRIRRMPTTRFRALMARQSLLWRRVGGGITDSSVWVAQA